MRFLDLFWWFLDGDKSSAEIISEKKQQVQVKSEEATSEGVEENEEFYEEFYD